LIDHSKRYWLSNLSKGGNEMNRDDQGTSQAYDGQGNEVNLDDIRQEDRDQLLQDLESEKQQDDAL
jgi:hypothetical protein